MSTRAYRIALVVILVASSLAHFWALGLRPLAHDEAIDAWFSWQARSGGVMRYDPVYHGPLRFYLEGIVLNTFGTSPGWARTVAALAGVGATMLIAASHRLLGRTGAVIGAIVFTVSPTVLTVTRTGREDSLVGLTSLAILLVVARGLTRPASWQIVGAGALLAVSFGLKETTFIFGFAGACYFLVLGAIAWRRPAGAARTFFRALHRLGTAPWLWASSAFIMLFALIFTSGFRYAQGFESGLVDGIRYWAGQHEVGRGGQRWPFYLSILAAYEWLVLLLAGAGLAATVRRRSLVGAWFATMAAVQLAVYTWAGEKFAWLALHPTIPLVLLAALGAQEIADTSTKRSRAVLGGALVLAVGATATVAVRPAITDGADPRELLVTVQTSTDVHEISSRLAAAERDGRVESILVDQRDGGSWPWAWYLHERERVEYVDIDPSVPLPEGYDAYIVLASGEPPPLPDGYTIERFPLRSWWLPDYDDAGLGDLARWWFTRRTWNPTGSTDQYLIIRNDAVP